MIAPHIRWPLFDLGRIVATSSAWEAICQSDQDVGDFLDRHVHGDWGAIFKQEELKNERAISTGDAIKSVYRTDNGIKIWVVTEKDEESGRRTTIRLPAEAASELRAFEGVVLSSVD